MPVPGLLTRHIVIPTTLARSLAMSSSSTETTKTDVEAGSSENEAPRLSALFLIRFDKKVGYVLVRHLVVYASGTGRKRDRERGGFGRGERLRGCASRGLE